MSAAPANAAAPPSIHKARLLRFTRPFVASSRKGAAAGVPTRKWRADESSQPQGALFTAVSRRDVEDAIATLMPDEVARALARKDPIAPQSAEAAALRASRFGVRVTDTERHQGRESRFAPTDAATLSQRPPPTGALGAAAVVDAAEANRLQRFATTSSSAGGAPLSADGAAGVVVVSDADAARRAGRFETHITAQAPVASGAAVTAEQTRRAARFVKRD